MVGGCVGKIGGASIALPTFSSFRKWVVASVRFTILTGATDSSEASNGSKATNAGSSY